MSWSVFVTRELPGPALERLRNSCDDLEVYRGEGAPSEQELLKGVEQREGILCLLSDTVGPRVMDRAGNRLKGIANYAVGYDIIDVEEATRRGIPVSNTPGVLTDTTADLAWALLFAAARRVAEADRFTRTGRWKGWSPTQMLGVDVSGATLGIVGTGRIGKAMARKSAGFGMNLLCFNRHDGPELERDYNAKKTGLKDLLGSSDFVSLHVPLTEKTHHLVGVRELGWMKETAVLINTSRGAVIDEAALVEALKNGELFGAGLDVYEEEPELSPGLADLDNVVLTPHIGSASRSTRSEMALMAAEDLLRMLDGRPPEHGVNPQVFE